MKEAINEEKLPKYRCTKEVWAKPMTYHKAGEALIRDYESPETKDDEEGYLAIYKGGYKSWSPKQIFESGYEQIN